MVSGNAVTIFLKGRLRDRHRVAEGTEMSAIAHFLCKNVAWIDEARDVRDVGIVIVVAFIFTTLIFLKAEVLDALVMTEADHWMQALLSL